jgi:hypothetical protein
MNCNVKIKESIYNYLSFNDRIKYAEYLDDASLMKNAFLNIIECDSNSNSNSDSKSDSNSNIDYQCHYCDQLTDCNNCYTRLLIKQVCRCIEANRSNSPTMQCHDCHKLLNCCYKCYNKTTNGSSYVCNSCKEDYRF